MPSCFFSQFSMSTTSPAFGQPAGEIAAQVEFVHPQEQMTAWHQNPVNSGYETADLLWRHLLQLTSVPAFVSVFQLVQHPRYCGSKNATGMLSAGSWPETAGRPFSCGYSDAIQRPVLAENRCRFYGCMSHLLSEWSLAACQDEWPPLSRRHPGPVATRRNPFARHLRSDPPARRSVVGDCRGRF